MFADLPPAQIVSVECPSQGYEVFMSANGRIYKQTKQEDMTPVISIRANNVFLFDRAVETSEVTDSQIKFSYNTFTFTVDRVSGEFYMYRSRPFLSNGSSIVIIYKGLCSKIEPFNLPENKF